CAETPKSCAKAASTATRRRCCAPAIRSSARCRLPNIPSSPSASNGRQAGATCPWARQAEPHSRELESAQAANSVRSLPRLRGREREGGMQQDSCVQAHPLPNPPAEVGFIRLRAVNRQPNSGKPEFGCKRERGCTESAAS